MSPDYVLIASRTFMFKGYPSKIFGCFLGRDDAESWLEENRQHIEKGVTFSLELIDR